MFYLLRMLTIIAEVVTIKPRCIGGDLTFLVVFLVWGGVCFVLFCFHFLIQVTVGNAIKC